MVFLYFIKNELPKLVMIYENHQLIPPIKQRKFFVDCYDFVKIVPVFSFILLPLFITNTISHTKLRLALFVFISTVLYMSVFVALPRVSNLSNKYQLILIRLFQFMSIIMILISFFKLQIYLNIIQILISWMIWMITFCFFVHPKYCQQQQNTASSSEVEETKQQEKKNVVVGT